MNQQNFDAIKIAFFDIDGTLVDMNKKVITPRMLDTLIQLKQKGLRICGDFVSDFHLCEYLRHSLRGSTGSAQGCLQCRRPCGSLPHNPVSLQWKREFRKGQQDMGKMVLLHLLSGPPASHRDCEDSGGSMIWRLKRMCRLEILQRIDLNESLRADKRNAYLPFVF